MKVAPSLSTRKVVLDKNPDYGYSDKANLNALHPRSSEGKVMDSGSKKLL